MISKREAAIISAYTGFVLGDFGETHKYIEQILDRPVWSHELGFEAVQVEIREKARSDYMKLEVEK